MTQYDGGKEVLGQKLFLRKFLNNVVWKKWLHYSRFNGKSNFKMYMYTIMTMHEPNQSSTLTTCSYVNFMLLVT